MSNQPPQAALGAAIAPEREHLVHDPALFLGEEKNPIAAEKAAEEICKFSPPGENLSNNVPNVPVNLDDAIDAEKEDLDAAKAIFDAALLVCQDDPGVLFGDEFLDAVKTIRETDRALWAGCRVRLKKAKPSGVLLSDIDKETAPDGEGADGANSIAADLLVLAISSGELFHDPDAGKSFLGVNNSGVPMTYAIGSTDFIEWLSFKYYQSTKTGDAPGMSASETAIKQACFALSGIAKHEGEARRVYLRVADHNGGHYLFMGDAQWRAIEILPTGWRIVDNAPVKFWKPASMKPLPTPEPGGNLDLLWRYINIPEPSRCLALAWLLECWRANTPFPILALSGQQGSAKSSTQSKLRELIDHNAVNLRAAPKSVEDVYVSAGCNWLASFENISHLTPNMQDALCTLATGGGFAARTLYTNAEETVIEVKRPLIINSIPNVVTAQDLTDRAINIELPVIDDYIDESAITEGWERDKAAIMGGLLDLFSKTLARLPNIRLGKKPPRMADFTKLGEAMMTALGHEPGEFTEIYQANRRDSIAVALESSPAGLAVRELVDNHTGASDIVFFGTVKQLYDKLSIDHKQSADGWPRSPKGLSEAIKRQIPALAAIGITVIQGNSREYVDGQRGLTIKIVKHGHFGNNRNLSIKKSAQGEKLSPKLSGFYSVPDRGRI